MKVSDYISEFLVKNEIRHVFGIIGAGNAHIFDSIYRRGFTEVICVHHEQVACMAIQTYYRTNGKISAAILTTGGGSTNSITGVVSAWADSIPGIIISGNENSKYVESHKDLRMWGVQGYDSSAMVQKVTKYSRQVLNPLEIGYELDKAYALTMYGRPGPCWIDVPMNLQSAEINTEELRKFNPNSLVNLSSDRIEKIDDKIDNLIDLLNNSNRPLFWFGNGIRLSGGEDLLNGLLDKFKIPALVTWAGLDLIDSEHPLVFGRAGTYGQRCANLILQNCDLLICIGTRMAIPQIGYDISELARGADIAVVDIDRNELLKYEERCKILINADAKQFLERFLLRSIVDSKSYEEWIVECNRLKELFPWVTLEEHPDMDGFINSYRFMDKLNNYLKNDQHITTDMGTALLSGHQVLKLRHGQRLMTSTGLGEMGYGLPAAIGSSIARNRGEVMCLNCDGGMMMNLQELQTVVHYNLPIKIFIFNNDGYLMIKHTQQALFNGRRSGVDTSSGVSCPNFSALGNAFGIPSFQIRTWHDFDVKIPEIQEIQGPVICEVYMHPYQKFFPKLSVVIKEDGTLVSPPLEDLSPLIERDVLERNMMVGLHPKSKDLIN